MLCEIRVSKKRGGKCVWRNGNLQKFLFCKTFVIEIRVMQGVGVHLITKKYISLKISNIINTNL